MKPGDVVVVLNSRQHDKAARLLLAEGSDLVYEIVNLLNSDRPVMPFTAAAYASQVIIQRASNRKGRMASKVAMEAAQRFAIALTEYATHPAFYDPPTGLIGEHAYFLPAWSGRWWPPTGILFVRQVLRPTVRRWEGTAYTEWHPTRAKPGPRPGEPDFKHLERFAQPVRIDQL